MSNWINALATSALKVVKADMTLNISLVLCMGIKDQANFLVNRKRGATATDIESELSG